MYLDLIEKKNKDVSESWLYIIDENIKESDIKLLVSQKIVILTNRFDIYEKLRARDLKVFFNDFDLAVFDDRKFSQIFYRVSKKRLSLIILSKMLRDYFVIKGSLFYVEKKMMALSLMLKKQPNLLGL